MNAIESVQKQFSLFALKNLAWDHLVTLPSHEDILFISLPSLGERRYILGISHLVKLIDEAIDTKALLNEIYINVLVRSSRSYQLLKPS